MTIKDMFMIFSVLANSVYISNIMLSIGGSYGTKDVYARINRDGSFVDHTTSLICSAGHKIVLLKYRFLLLNCTLFDECLTVSEVPLLPGEELILYRKCSLQTKCEGLKFSTRSERNMANTLYIKYKCIAETVLYDICGNFSKSVTEVAYLTYGTNRLFRNCQCFVDGGQFQLVLSDIRLTERTKEDGEDKCSPAEIVVNERQVACDEKKDLFGSVFNSLAEGLIENAYIVFIPKSDVNLPENVLLTLKPKDSVKLSCQGESPPQRNLTIPSTEKVGTYSLQGTSTSTSTIQQPKYEYNTLRLSNNTTKTELLVILILVSLLVFGMSVHLLLKFMDTLQNQYGIRMRCQKWKSFMIECCFEIEAKAPWNDSDEETGKKERMSHNPSKIHEAQDRFLEQGTCTSEFLRESGEERSDTSFNRSVYKTEFISLKRL